MATTIFEVICDNHDDSGSHHTLARFTTEHEAKKFCLFMQKEYDYAMEDYDVVERTVHSTADTLINEYKARQEANRIRYERMKHEQDERDAAEERLNAFIAAEKAAAHQKFLDSLPPRPEMSLGEMLRAKLAEAEAEKGSPRY